MISSITNATPVQPTPQAATAKPASSSATPQASGSDTVQISSTAKVLQQETLQTPAQTAREARGGDLQAVRLLARESAEKASAK